MERSAVPGRRNERQDRGDDGSEKLFNSDSESAEDDFDADEQSAIKLTRASSDFLWKEFSDYYETGTLCDVKLVCKDGPAIACHKLMLAAVSKLMRKMLLQAEAQSFGETVVIHLPDVEFHDMKGVVNFLYIGFPKRGANETSGQDEVILKLEVMEILEIDLTTTISGRGKTADIGLKSDQACWRGIYKEPKVTLKRLANEDLDQYGVSLLETQVMNEPEVEMDEMEEAVVKSEKDLGQYGLDLPQHPVSRDKLLDYTGQHEPWEGFENLLCSIDDGPTPAQWKSNDSLPDKGHVKKRTAKPKETETHRATSDSLIFIMPRSGSL
jgi:hypothetical protein